MSRDDSVESTLPNQPAEDVARRANAAKSEFLAAMSHEMRTPLSSVSGFMELLAETDLDERQARWVESTRTASEHLVRLIDGVLDISRIEMGSISLVSDAVVVEEIVLEAVALIEPIATARPVMLKLVNHGPTELVVEADSGRLGQVLLNLLSNAIKFGPAASTVTITTCAVGSHARIEVRDKGPGIEPSQAERVFVPFDRLDARARGVAGIGLGLAVSRSLMLAMNGTLEIVNVKGPGAVFRVELPLVAPDDRDSIRLNAVRSGTPSRAR